MSAGRWKPLAYAVKRMYANLQVQVVQDGPQTKVFVVNDHTTAVNTSIAIRVLSLTDSADAAACSAQQPAAVFTVPVAPLFAEMVWTMPTEDLLATRKGCTATTCYISVTASGKVSSTPHMMTLHMLAAVGYGHSCCCCCHSCNHHTLHLCTCTSSHTLRPCVLHCPDDNNLWSFHTLAGVSFSSGGDFRGSDVPDTP
jgi:hypothetical protein